MAYQHILNLYQDARILSFKEVFALEKIHGTSSHIRWQNGAISFTGGGESHRRFSGIFNEPQLTEKLVELGTDPIVIYGECHGGRQQGMKETYGETLRFVVFEVKIGDSWLAVPQAAAVAEDLGLQFVDYDLIAADLPTIERHRDMDSTQAIRNGVGPGKKREGVVLRPPFEVTLNNGKRLVAKHKRDDFKETKTKRVVGADLVVLEEANAVADEWVTPMRLSHVLQKLPNAKGMEHTRDVIKAMTEDVLREGAAEIVDSKPVRKAIGKATVALWKARISQI